MVKGFDIKLLLQTSETIPEILNCYDKLILDNIVLQVYGEGD